MALFRSKSISSEVGGRPVNFYSLSIPVLFQLKSAVGPIAKLLNSFFRRDVNDVTRVAEKTIDVNGKPVELVQQLAISPELAKLRSEQSISATKDTVEQLFADQNRQLLGRVLMDSMRDDFPRKPSGEQLNQFIDELDLAILGEMVQGVARANAEVFGPLGRKWAKVATDQLRAQASSASPNSASNEPSAPDDTLPEVTD